MKTSLDRVAEKLEIPGEDVKSLERDMLREFRRVYYRYAQHLPVDKMEWLANMQHHGTPTRLLDCTYSIFVAAYFALEYATCESAVWALNTEWLLSESIGRLEGAGHEDAGRLGERFDESHAPLIDRWFFSSPPTQCAAPLNSFRLNERLAVQRGFLSFRVIPGLQWNRTLHRWMDTGWRRTFFRFASRIVVD